ncbi:MAG TPA: hypothetical protein VL400_15920 [Polyangiaceae bacterium]|nr:hypothetical protein [Polyangiaceae bacterium]
MKHHFATTGRRPAPALMTGLFFASIVAVGCGGAQQADEDTVPLTTPTFEGGSRPPPADTATADSGGATGEMNADQKDMIKVALRRGGDKAKNCNTVTNSNVSGEGEVQVVFDGTAGKVVDAQVGAPFAGTDVEACVKQSFVDEIVLPFEGKLTVPYTVKLEPNKNLPPPGTKKKTK